ncbi:MAG: methyltransferase [Clostridia bacterium]|nr:methyltransferase [Clostridia bacterium]
MTKLTLEHFENGVKLYQDEDLYKFTSDSIKLAKFCKIKASDNVLDMCAGSGVVGLYAYSLTQCNKIYFNDIQPQMCELIDKNIALNNLNNKSMVLCKDLSELTLDDFDKRLDVVVCNPPYFKMTGKIKEDIDVAICRHEITTNLQQIITKAGELIKSKGRFYLVIPSNRLCECIVVLNQNKFEVKNIEIYHNKNKSTICLLESIKDANSGVLIKIKSES